MKATLFLVAILGQVFCAKQDYVKLPAPRIVNGYEVIPHSIPYQALLLTLIKTRNNKIRISKCGGSLISQRYILTAAHCVRRGQKGLAILGAHNIKAKEKSRILIFFKEIIIHKDYCPKHARNDIALIKLTRPVNLSKEVNVALLPTRKETKNKYTGMLARVSGWGYTNGSGYSSAVLVATENTVMENSECNKYYPFKLLDKQICISSDGGRSACKGDSGGPLVELVHNKLIGVASQGAADCKGGPSIYTRVGDFLDWIQEHSDRKIM